MAKESKNIGMNGEKLLGPGKCLYLVVMLLEQFRWDGAVLASNVLTVAECVPVVHAYTLAHVYDDSAVAPLQVPMCSQTRIPRAFSLLS